MIRPYIITDERSVVGSYKTNGANDDESIYLAKKTLLASNKGRLVSVIILWVASFIPAAWAVLMIAIGAGFPYISLIFACGFFAWGFHDFRKYRKVVDVIEEGTKRHCESLSIPAV